jgi:hypothetical protein
MQQHHQQWRDGEQRAHHLAILCAPARASLAILHANEYNHAPGDTPLQESKFSL